MQPTLATKYEIKYTKLFKKQYRKVLKRGKNKDKFIDVLSKLANDIELEEKYHDHLLINTKQFNNYRECHIEPDWLLIYKKYEEKLILVLIETGSHSDLF